MKNLLILTVALSVNIFANFDFGTCSGSGTFEQQIVQYKHNYENAATVGTIPPGIQGLHVALVSDNDVDIRLYSEHNGSIDKIVHWPYGLLNDYKEETIQYQDINVTYSGYNGVDGEQGHEFIDIEGSTPNAMTIKAFGYRAGYATVNYSWTGKDNCTVAPSGTGHFTQNILHQDTNIVGTIPKNVKNVKIYLTSDNDLDIQLYTADGTTLVSWKPTGLISGSSKQTLDYNGMNIEWSGYNGTAGNKGHEYIYITNTTTETLIMKVYGYQAGIADVNYTWGENNTTTFPKEKNFIQHSIELSPPTIESVSINILESQDIPLPSNDDINNNINLEKFPDGFFHATNIHLIQENNNIYLENLSFRKIKSLIGKYTDSNNEIQLIKLDFNQTIEPFSKNKLTPFMHDTIMKIYHTSNMFDGEYRLFYEKADECITYDCSEKEKIPGKEYYRKVKDDAERTGYYTVLNNIFSFYNSVDALPVFHAWAYNGTYDRNKDGMDELDVSTFEKPCSNFSECSHENIDEQNTYLYNTFFRSASRSIRIGLRALYQTGNALGTGAGQDTSSGGEFISTGKFAAKGNLLNFMDAKGNDSSKFYSTFYHELMHSLGYSHASGMTYGFADVFQIYINTYYPNPTEYKNIIVSQVPEYVFLTSATKDNKVHIKIFRTDNSNTRALTLEILSPDNMSTKVENSHGTNQITLVNQKLPSYAYYVRVYGENSMRVMSKLIYPSDYNSTLLYHVDNKEVYTISYAQWKDIVDSHANYVPKGKPTVPGPLIRDDMRVISAEDICNVWTKGYNARLANEDEVYQLKASYNDTIQNYTSKNFLALGNEGIAIFDLNSTEIIRSKKLKNLKPVPSGKEDLHILCVKE